MEGYMSTTANAYISFVVSNIIYINKCNPQKYQLAAQWQF